MRHQHLSKWWFLGPPFAIVLTALVYYGMFPSVRAWVDTRFPWVATHIGVHLPARDATEQAERMRAAAPPSEPSPSEPAVPPTPPPPVPAPLPVYVSAEGAIDLPKLSANRADWPKVVLLKEPKEFPAVVEGKVVGKAVVPKETEVHLLKIEGGKLGLEYRGGGAWADAKETDLADRLRSAGH